MPNIDKIWERIVEHEGKAFHTITDKSFTYEVSGKVLKIIRDGKEINQNISISNFEKTMSCLPLKELGDIPDSVRGSSYVFAIMTDERIIR